MIAPPRLWRRASDACVCSRWTAAPGAGIRRPVPPPPRRTRTAAAAAVDQSRPEDAAAARGARSAARKMAEVEERNRGHCAGCGIRLQSGDAGGIGFLPAAAAAADPAAPAQEAASAGAAAGAPTRLPPRRQAPGGGGSGGTLPAAPAAAPPRVCARCAALQRGEMVAGVEDFYQRLIGGRGRRGGFGGGAAAAAALAAAGGAPAAEIAAAPARDAGERPPLLTPEQLRAKLQHISSKFAVACLLVDLTDASGTLLATARSLVGANPLFLIGTKADLLPRGTSPAEVGRWLAAAARCKKLAVAGTSVVSAATGAGLAAAVAAVEAQRAGRDLYILGAANVGKSAFVRAYAAAAAAAGAARVAGVLPTESPMPGTTLGNVAVAAFTTGGLLLGARSRRCARC